MSTSGHKTLYGNSASVRLDFHFATAHRNKGLAQLSKDEVPFAEMGEHLHIARLDLFPLRSQLTSTAKEYKEDEADAECDPRPWDEPAKSDSFRLKKFKSSKL